MKDFSMKTGVVWEKDLDIYGLDRRKIAQKKDWEAVFEPVEM
jgi:hypothetical protein